MRRAIVIAAALMGVAAGGSQVQIRTTGTEADPVVAVVNGENIHRSSIVFFTEPCPTSTAGCLSTRCTTNCWTA